VRDITLQHLVRGQPDDVAEALSFEELVDPGQCKRRIAPEVAAQLPIPVSGDNGLQHVAPFMGTVDVAGAQRTTLQVAELVEHEQRVIAGAAEMTVVGRAFLLAMGRADGTVRRAAALDRLAADDPAHRGITSEPVRVVHVFIPGQTAIDGLA
jgi:hypothetical protein